MVCAVDAPNTESAADVGALAQGHSTRWVPLLYVPAMDDGREGTSRYRQGKKGESNVTVGATGKQLTSYSQHSVHAGQILSSSPPHSHPSCYRRDTKNDTGASGATTLVRICLLCRVRFMRVQLNVYSASLCAVASSRPLCRRRTER